jgi:sulfur relay (sulfurtransferase) DsrC/TusE family protein
VKATKEMQEDLTRIRHLTDLLLISFRDWQEAILSGASQEECEHLGEDHNKVHKHLRMAVHRYRATVAITVCLIFLAKEDNDQPITEQIQQRPRTA